MIILTGEGPDAFCSGGDQRVRGDDGYLGDDETSRRRHWAVERSRPADPDPPASQACHRHGRGLRDRRWPCAPSRLRPDDCRRQRAFGQTGPRSEASTGVTARGSWRGRSVSNGPRRSGSSVASTSQPRPSTGGSSTRSCPSKCFEAETLEWCRGILALSPMALRMLKASFNAADDGLAGIQQLAGDATMLFYMSEEGQEGRNAYVEKRSPDFSRFPRRP